MLLETEIWVLDTGRLDLDYENLGVRPPTPEERWEPITIILDKVNAYRPYKKDDGTAERTSLYMGEDGMVIKVHPVEFDKIMKQHLGYYIKP